MAESWAPPTEVMMFATHKDLTYESMSSYNRV